MLMFPTSLPGGNPAGIVAARPTSPLRASAASTGMAATSSGVRPPSSSTGSSLAPSGTHTTYFISFPFLSALLGICPTSADKNGAAGRQRPHDRATDVLLAAHDVCVTEAAEVPTELLELVLALDVGRGVAAVALIAVPLDE